MGMMFLECPPFSLCFFVSELKRHGLTFYTHPHVLKCYYFFDDMGFLLIGFVFFTGKSALTGDLGHPGLFFCVRYELTGLSALCSDIRGDWGNLPLRCRP